MNDAPFDIHVHGQIPLRADVRYEQIQEALKPLWQYAGKRSLADAAESAYEEEPGIRFDAKQHLLDICWTVEGDVDFRQAMDEVCMHVNDIAERGAAIELSFYDAQYDEEDEQQSDDDIRDDFVLLFVGPTPAAILQVQRDLVVEDVVHTMERHFDGSELGDVVAAIDALFAQRFDALVTSLDLSRPPPPRGGGGHGGPSGGSGHGGRRPRHLH